MTVMNDAKVTAQQIATASPAEADAIFARLPASEQVRVIVAAAEQDVLLICAVRCAAFARALKTLPELSGLSDGEWFACFPSRQVRLRHAWNSELDGPVPQPFGSAVAVVAVRRKIDGFDRTPLMVGSEWAAVLSSPGSSDAQCEAAIASLQSLPGVTVRDNVRPVR
jgi:hypothetical protein